MDLKTSLHEFGLSEKESAIYLELLSRDDQTAFSIAKRTKIPKTTVYHTLESLEGHGLVNSWKKNNVAFYGAESPNKLISILDRRKDVISTILPQLLDITTQKSRRTKVKQYEGGEGLKTVFEEILETLDKESIKRIDAISNQNLLKIIPRYFPKWLDRRKTMGIYTRLLVTETKTEKIPELFKSDNMREARPAPEQLHFKSSIEIFGNKTAIISTEDEKNPVAVVIQSKEISDVFRQLFELAWVGAKSEAAVL